MPSPAPAPHPWNMRHDETAKAYQAFQVFRDMGADRTLEAVGKTLAKSRQALDKWVARYAWRERAAAFDAEAARIASARSLNDHAEVRARQAGLGRMMQAKGGQRVGTLDPSTLEAKEARMLLVEGAKMEREALGIPASVAVTGADGGPVETVTKIIVRWPGDPDPDDPDDSA